MTLDSRTVRAWTVLFVIALAFAACARSPEATKARHLTRGDAYFRRGQYRAAILEYRNALRLEVTNARAIQQLGLAHYHAGEWGQALPGAWRPGLRPDQPRYLPGVGCRSSSASSRSNARPPNALARPATRPT